MKKLLLLCVIFMSLLHAEDFECIEVFGGYKIVYEGTRNEADEVGGNTYTNEESCVRGIKDFVNGVKRPKKYECFETFGGYKIVYEGTRNEADEVGGKTYTNEESCVRGIKDFVNGVKRPKKYECFEAFGGYKIVYEGTRNEADEVGGKTYTNEESCVRGIKDFVNGVKRPKKYECFETFGGYKIVYEGTRNEADEVGGKTYTNEDFCIRSIKDFVNGVKRPKKYECFEAFGGYKIVYEGTRNEANEVGGRTYRERKFCEKAVTDYLRKRK